MTVLRRLPSWAWPAGVLLLSWVAVDPSGNFPLNDDWAYASPVRRLAAGEGLRLSDWATPFDLPAVFSAALLAKILGFSHVLLRFTTALWAFAGLWILDRCLREEDVPVLERGLTAATLFFCPLFFLLTFSFHTEIPFLTLCFAALFLFRRADRTGELRWEAAGGVAVALAFLTRQTGAAILLGETLWILLRRRASPSRLSALWGPSLLLGGGFLAWFWIVHGPTWAFVNYFLGGTGEHVSSGRGFFSTSAARAAASLLTAALFASPMLPAVSGRRRLAQVFLLAAPFALFLRTGWGLPFFGNAWHPLGLGPLTGIGSEAKPVLQIWASPLPWAGMGVAAAAAAGVFISSLKPLTATPAARHVLCLWLPLALATLPGGKFFDRYILMWLPLFLLPSALSGVRGGVPLRAALLFFWGLVSWSGTRDYFAWNRAKWSLGAEAVSSGLSPREVANGVDWAAWHLYDEAMADLRRRKPLREIEEMEWKRGDFPAAFVTFNPGLYPLAHLAAARPYRSPLARRMPALFLYNSRIPKES